MHKGLAKILPVFISAPPLAETASGFSLNRYGYDPGLCSLDRASSGLAWLERELGLFPRAVRVRRFLDPLFCSSGDLSQHGLWS